MRYVVRKERAAWIVRNTDGQFMAGHKTHATAINWANTLATTAARKRQREAIARIVAALARMGKTRPAPQNGDPKSER